MKTTLLIVLGALGLVTVGCASTTEDGDPTPSTTETAEADGETGESADALQVGNGPTLPDRDYCEGMRAGCTQSCKGNAGCIRNCNINYEKCRGLPPISGPGVIMALPAKPKPVPFCPDGEVRKCTLGPPPVCSCVPVTRAPVFSGFALE